MAANRKKGKKSQSANQDKSANNKNSAPAPQVSASDNAIVEVTAAPSESKTEPESQATTGSAEVSVPLTTANTESGSEVEITPAAESLTVSVSVESSAVSGGELAEIQPEPPSAVTVTVDGTYQYGMDNVEAAKATQSSDEESVVPDADCGVAGDHKTTSQSDVSPSPEEVAETASSEGRAETISKDPSDVKLTTKGDDATAVPETVAPAASPSPADVNFKKDEIRTLLVPVSPFHRLVACSIVIVTYSILGYITLKTPQGLSAQGLHTIDLPDAGSWVFFFKGDTQDANEWSAKGRFRKSLEIELAPVEPQQIVTPVPKIKDLSGTGFVSVAEFEVNQPGEYNLWIKWNDPASKCTGKIQYEKDPVETFFFKWALGIVGTIALFYMVGIPMTTRKAQTTLPTAAAK